MSVFFYICNNFDGNKVHSETILKLSKKYSKSKHYVFVPYSNKSLINKNHVHSENVFISYIYFYKFLKFFPIIKSIIIFLKIFLKIKKYNIEYENSKALAYTFWSDGIIALYLKIFLKTRFSVFVRVTDTSIFFKYGYHIKPLLYLINKKADYILFPSLVLKKECSKLRFFTKENNRLIFLPNAINDFWLENSFYFDNLSIQNKKILFVGSFDKNKNLLAVLNSCISLRSNRKDFILEFIGGSIAEFKALYKIDDIPDWVLVTEKISNKNELLLKYRKSNILIVPSFLETFGMVYLEAISQGCFAVYSKNQGIDHLFHNGFSYSTNPYDTQEMAYLLDKLLDKDFQVHSLSLKENLNFLSSSTVINLYSKIFD